MRTVVVLVSVVFVFGGCSRQTSSVSLPVDTTRTFSYSGDRDVPGRWWTVFGDPQLNVLVDSALGSSFTLMTAWQRLHEAKAIVDRETSSLFPTLDASVEGELSQYQTRFVQSQQLRLGLASQYEVDLWGRIRSSIEAQRYRAEATLQDYRTAALSLSAEVVRTWYQLMEATSQLELINQQVETNEKMLRLMKNRFGSGQIRSVDILRQRQLLESTREQRITAESRVQVLEHQLAVLLGRIPQGQFNYQTDTLPGLPPLPETGVPAELIRRRPDVQSAFNSLQAADRQMAAAISNRYPRFSLSASVSTAADQAGDLFEDWARSLTGNLLTPILYGGRLSAEVDRAEAVKKQRLYEYGQTMLTAFREVEDALIQEKKQRERIESLKDQIKLARQSYEQLRVSYFNGVAGYLDVLTALDEEQQMRRNLLSARLLLLEHRVALYRSLAGGFQTERERMQ